jgi:diguanylate cyclase (GGDEF)-like protein
MAVCAPPGVRGVVWQSLSGKLKTGRSTLSCSAALLLGHTNLPGRQQMQGSAMLDPRWRRLGRVRLFCNASCATCVLVGGLILLGWASGVSLLKAAFLGVGAIEPNTALSLILLGVSLWLLLPDPPRRVRRVWGLALAGAVTSLGALTLFERRFHLDLGVDHLFFAHAAASARMAPITAATIFVLGLALLLLDAPTRLGARPSQLLSLWGGLAAVMSVSGYINGADAIYGFFSFALVAVYISLLLFLVSAAIFFARPKVGIPGDLMGKFIGSSMARRLLPVLIAVPLAAAWFRVRAEQAGWFGTELGLAFNVTTNVLSLSLVVWLYARNLNKADESLHEARQAKEALWDASLRDELTGLYNRRGFLTFAEEQMKLAHSGRRELVVLFADVDGLKAINDGYGHAEGDRAIKAAAEVLLTVFRDTDLISRLAGDEFAVLALDCSRAGLVRIEAHLEKVLRASNHRGNPWKLSISLGAIHVDSEHPVPIDEVLGRADKMMYERKRAKPVLAAR